MATRSSPSEPVGPLGPDWVSAVASGLIASLVVGIVIYVGFDAAIIEESIPDPFGQSGLVAGFAILLVIGVFVGLVYGALNAIPQLDEWASTSRTGGILGLVYGLVLWGLAVVSVPFVMGDGASGIGDYAVSLEGLLGYALFGVLVGVLYLLVPVLRTR